MTAIVKELQSFEEVVYFQNQNQKRIHDFSNFHD